MLHGVVSMGRMFDLKVSHFVISINPIRAVKNMLKANDLLGH
jgi:hypothetical protein